MKNNQKKASVRRLQPHKRQPLSRYVRLRLLPVLFVLVFGTMGSVYLFFSNAATPINSPWRITSGLSTNRALCIDDWGSHQTNGNEVDISGCNASGAQDWQYNSVNNTVRLVDTSMCIGVNDSKVFAEAFSKTGTLPVQTFGCRPTAASLKDSNQQWLRGVVNGQAELQNVRLQQLCLTASAAAPGSRLVVSTCKGTPIDPAPDQSWSIGNGTIDGTCTEAMGPFEQRGTKIFQANGKTFIPYGITLSDLQGTQYQSQIPALNAKIFAAAHSWCSNTVRLQIEQDQLVWSSAEPPTAPYMYAVENAVSYAQSLGLVVVINDQTEPDTGVSANEPLPTYTTEAFWRQIDSVYHNDPQVIYDLFNEPRAHTSSEASEWDLWQNGGLYRGKTYLGTQTLVTYIRHTLGSTRLLWIEGIYFSDTLDGIPTHAITGGAPLAYALHHPTGQHNAAAWYKDFAFLIHDNIAPVVDGEWTNWASGTNPECWQDAPTAVPQYLSYLQSYGIGLTVWTLDPGVMVSTAGNYTKPTTINQNWSCTNGLDQGAGSLVQNWYQKNNSG